MSVADEGERVLITGITGFVGSHLAEFVLAEYPRVRVFGLKRWRSPLENIEGILDRVTLLDGDLLDQGSLVRALQESRPDIVFHLAAQSYVTASQAYPAMTMMVNGVGTLNLLEAVRMVRDLERSCDPLVHVVSSSEVYGQVRKEDLPVTEACPFRPANPYGASKVAADMVALVYWQSHGIRTVRSRMFTHSGPRRSNVFVDSAFAWQLARIECGLQEPVLRVGNLDSQRTFADVRDTVWAYWLLTHLCPPGEVYNIGGSATMTIGEMLDRLLLLSHVGDEVEVRQDATLLRRADVTYQVPCVDKFRAATGWEPRHSYGETLLAMLDYWRGRMKK